MEQTQEKTQLTAVLETKPAKNEKPFIPKKKRKWPKRILTLLVVAGIVAVAVKNFSGNGAGTISASYIPSVSSMQEMVVSVTGTGTIEPIHSYKVTTLIKGEVVSAPFEEGQVVAKGDLLFRIDSKDVENNIKQLELSLRSAKLSYDDVVKQQSNGQKDLDIKANATGVVTELHIDVGDKISAGTLIADILDRDYMKLVVPFHSTQVANFSVGQTAIITVDGTNSTLTGTVDSIAVTDTVGVGGTLVRNVTILLQNPGTLSDASSGAASVEEVDCAQSATFEYSTSKQLIAKASGEVVQLDLEKGDRIQDGQMVGRFKATDMAYQLDVAGIALENATLNLKNAREKLEDYAITSTIAGTVIEKNFEVGDNIDPTASGAAYPAVIYDLSTLTFDVRIDELDISKIAVGQTVEITADAVESTIFTGIVDKVNINGITQNNVTTYPVTVLVDEATAALYPGMNVSAKILVEEVGSVLCIPVEAVQRGSTVLVAGAGALDEQGNLINPAALEERVVTLGRNDSQNIEILSGLASGETVYIPNASSNAMAMMMGG